jgi:demethylmenaquinone methyltransferase / 2-methoxy-6-polyprenyl-1,4-benzoquinol methylase
MPDYDFTGREKETFVHDLFASAARRYDFLNGVMSLGRHKAWRRFAVRQLGLLPGGEALDVAAGTADFTVDLLRAAGPEGKVIGVDFCPPMLEIGAVKLRRLGLESGILSAANAEALPFPDGTFDCATIGFALRNVSSVKRTLREMARVVRPGGRVLTLEIVGPDSGLILPFWRLYFNRLAPVITGLLSGRKDAYRYLPASVERFRGRQELKATMEECGLVNVRMWNLALGAVCVHVGTRS